MIGGYMGKILFVDLTQAKMWEETPNDSLYQDLLGGYGIGAKILFDRQKPRVDPLGPDAMLGFTTGPLTGTSALIGSRYTAVAKSPLTDTWGDANSGGDFGPFLKFAGYDAVFCSGISPEPVYLLVNNGKAELRKAGGLWGKDTAETESLLQDDLGRDARIACIGPSGEKLSLISCIINNRSRAAGRSGLGAVMGSKKLKAVAVKGNNKVPIVNKLDLKAARTKHLGQLNSRAGKFKQFGTVAGMAHAVQTGDTPVKNWSGTALDFPNAAAISDNSVINMQERKYACWHCPIACGGLMKAGSGEYSYQPGAHKPEYETLAAFGSMCLNDHLESIIKLNDICNRSGLDTISAGAIVAFAIECYENGIINNRDTDGIELRWGNHKSIVEITEKLVKREGLGNVLADGVMRAAKQIGSEAEKIAIHIHGQEVPMHDPKRYLSYATAYLDTTPARHTQGSCGSMPASGLECPPYDKGSFSGRGEANKMGSDLMHIVNCSGVCLFGFQFMDASAIPEFINSTTGWTYSINDLLKIGERIASLRQAFNIREGVSISAFTIPGRVRGNPPLPIGPTAGKSVDMETLRNDYLIARDWDIKTGKPSKKKLLDLGLSDVAKVLWGGEK